MMFLMLQQLLLLDLWEAYAHLCMHYVSLWSSSQVRWKEAAGDSICTFRGTTAGVSSDKDHSSWESAVPHWESLLIILNVAMNDNFLKYFLCKTGRQVHIFRTATLPFCQKCDKVHTHKRTFTLRGMCHKCLLMFKCNHTFSLLR